MTKINREDYWLKGDLSIISPRQATYLKMKYPKALAVLIVNKKTLDNHLSFFPISRADLLEKTLAYYEKQESTEALWVSMKQIEKRSEEYE